MVDSRKIHCLVFSVQTSVFGG